MTKHPDKPKYDNLTGKDHAKGQPVELSETELAKASGGVALNFSKPTVEYKPQKPDGAAD